MKRNSLEMRRLLAAEYVLGTLSGLSRRRFERQARGDADLRAEMYFWEIRLGELAKSVPPVAPPDMVWISLQRRIAAGNTVPLRRPAAATKPARGPQSWRILAGLATAAAVVLAVLLNQHGAPPVVAPTANAPVVANQDVPVTAPVAPVAQANVEPATPAAASFVALLKMPNSNMQWTVSLRPTHRHMTVATAGAAQLKGRSPELWWLSAKGPVALGVLPVSGSGSMPLPAGIPDDGELKLAVSLEPHGGSPTGKPTGPVVTSATAVRAA